jgi:hypothetical protein
MIAIRFYATGNFLITLGDFAGIHKATVSRILKKVTRIIASLKSKFIYMPRDRAERREAYSNFYNIARFPNVIGTIDCTHVRIQSPGNLFN